MMLPLPLVIIVGVLVIQLILLFVIKKKKRKIVLFTIIFVLGIGVWQGLLEYNRTNKDLSKVKADVKISATNIINEYKANDSIADQKYLGKIIELNGNVKKVENDGTGNYTIVMGENGSLSSVRCTMDTVYRNDASKVVEGSSVTVRGACTGYKKNELLDENLGSDVEINRAIVVKNN